MGKPDAESSRPGSIMENKKITYTETELTPEVLEKLIDFSVAWEDEKSCHGYRRNEKEDIDGNRIFLAKDGEETIAYLFGHVEKTKEDSSVMKKDTLFFEVEELYVVPERRSSGIGKGLFEYVERAVCKEAGYMMLGTATKNWKAILHFYLDELGMEFWSARLFKKIQITEVDKI